MIEKMRDKITDMKYRMLVKGLLMQEEVKDRRSKLKEFWGDNRGVAIIEVILILVVVMALGIAFRKEIKKVFDNIFIQINDNGSEAMKKY